MLDYTFNQYIQIALLGGFLGTSAMSGVLYLVTHSGYANCDMVRATGSLITKSLDNSFQVGIIIHFISGIIFSILYALVLDFLSVDTFQSAVGYGAALGVFHGAVVNFGLVILVAEHHPLEQFQQFGFSVAIVHWGAHIVYGTVVGIAVGAVIS